MTARLAVPARACSARPARAVLALAVLALSLLALAAPAADAHHGRAGLASGPLAPLGDQGRWLTDAAGRVVLLHGVNEVAKSAPYYPGAFGFGADDARFIARQGFNAVRLGVEFQGLMPEPGRIDRGYIEALARTVTQLSRRHVFVLLDFHQDGFGPRYGGNGFPAWMSLDDGLPNPPGATFPLYYIQNPAMQRAFESFWANRPGPGGVGLQDRFVAGLRAVVARFRHAPYVLGYELMNEPWPGADWQPCATGCPALEASLLGPFYRKATAAVRGLTRRQQVLVEPFVLFNFGQGPTSLPGRGTGDTLSTHSYALSPAGEDAVVDHSVAAAQRDGAPVLLTEFGATTDIPTLQRLTSGFDRGLVPWFFWAYNEEIVTDRSAPAGLATVRSLDVLKALARPYPAALAGTPESLAFDPATRALELRYSTTGPGGRRYRPGTASVIAMPSLAYPDGYAATVTGGRVASRPCARRLVVLAARGASAVTVRAAPAAGCG
ncbi:MAG: cellulase family glycosylhydrolase [Solirubrobacteraceae bacterium]